MFFFKFYLKIKRVKWGEVSPKRTFCAIANHWLFGFQTAQAYVIMRIKARSKSSICVLAVLDDTADSRDETIPNFSKELKIEI